MSEGRNRWSRLMIAGFLLLIFAALLKFPTNIAGGYLDDSWKKSFSYFFKTGMQAGKDYIFTYGPLGYFNTTVFDGDLFWASFFWVIISKAFFVYYLYGVLKPTASLGLNIFRLVLIALFLPMLPDDVISLLFLTIIGLRLTNNGATRKSRVLDLILLSVLSLGKFLYFVFSSVIVVLHDVMRRKDRERDPFPATLIFAVCFSAAWIAARQSIFGLPEYLYGSLQISKGYNEAMAIYRDSNETILSIVLLFLVLLTLIERNRFRNNTVQTLILITGLFVTWKLGFVRQDNHPAIFFGYAFSLILLFATPEFPVRRSNVVAIAAIVCVLVGAVTGIYRSIWPPPEFHYYPVRTLIRNFWSTIDQNIRIVISPAASKSKLEKEENAQRSVWAFPEVSAVVGNASIDVIPYQQGVLFLNNLNWRPRPVFQSYSAYTSYLAKKNADFFLSPMAPDYVLFTARPIDRRFPPTEDGMALLEIFQRYEPVLTERKFILLQRLNPSAFQKMNRTLLRKEQIRFGQRVMIHQNVGFQLLRLNIKETTLEKFRNIIYKPPQVRIIIEMNDGEHRDHRLIPSLARNGFLLSPTLLTTGDVVRYYQESPGPTIKSFVISTRSPGLWFGNEIEMEIDSISSLARSQFSQEELNLLMDSAKAGSTYKLKIRN